MPCKQLNESSYLQTQVGPFENCQSPPASDQNKKTKKAEKEEEQTQELNFIRMQPIRIDVAALALGMGSVIKRLAWSVFVWVSLG